MSYTEFQTSQFLRNKSPNLTRLGFDFVSDPSKEYKKIQSMLYSMYHIKCESMLTIMKHFGIPSSKTMDTLFRLFDIESRSFSESAQNAIIQNRATIPTTTFSHIYHTTWYDDVVYLRSTYEQEFAIRCDQNKIQYLVEHLRIKYFDTTKNRYRIAIPDFYLPKTNTIVEVKATYWLDEQEMKDKQKSYLAIGYNFNLFLDHVLIEKW